MKQKHPEIIFAGTSSGKTSIKRNHTSFLIKSSSHNLLIEVGDGISKALLSIKINFNEIDSVLFTHHHADHFAGIASLVTQMKLSARTKPLFLFTHKNLVTTISGILNSVYMFKETLGFKLKIKGYEFGKSISVCEEIDFTAKQNSHLRKKEKLKKYPVGLFVSSSMIFKVAGKKIFYSSDIGADKDLYVFEKQSADYAIVECSHIGFDELVEFFRKTTPKKIFIVHYDDDSKSVLEKQINRLPTAIKNKFILCSDGFSFPI